MKKLVSVIAAAILLVATPAFAQQTGTTAPNFEGTLLSGEKFSLGDHIGKDLVVLNFFTTDCAPCREEIPGLNAFYAAHKDDHVVVLGVDAIENPEHTKAYAKAFGVAYPLLVDGGELSRALNVTGWPTTVAIGADGKILFWELNVIDVPVVLGALLKVNDRLVKEGKGTSVDDFSKAQTPPGNVIHVVPPAVKPVEGSEKSAQKNEIFDIKVAHETRGEMDVDIDYYYAGDHGTTRVYIDCDPHTADGGAPFGMRPAIAEVGRHTAHAPLSSYDGTPPGTVSTEITCSLASRLDSAQMATKTVPYKKAWGQ